MVKVKWLDRELVRAPHLVLATTQEHYTAVVRHLKLESHDEWLRNKSVACVHTFENDEALMCVVCLDAKRCEDPINVATALVHESVHVFQQLCERIGESEPSREFEAYSIERISEQLMREYVRQTGKR